MAKWFAAHMPGERVMISASHSYLANVITDIPQLSGGHEPSATNFRAIEAAHYIYKTDAPLSILWLKSFGARAVTVPGPGSTEYFKPFVDPLKFEGMLPVLWRENDDTIYGIPSPAHSLAYAIALADVVPVGIDLEGNPSPLVRFVAAIESAEATSLRWINRHEVRIIASLRAGQAVAVQITYDPGWRATVNGVSAGIKHDGLGLMVLQPACLGNCEIHLIYDGGSELRATQVASASAMVLTALLAIRLRSQRTRN
jgi:hypothetical protein